MKVKIEIIFFSIPRYSERSEAIIARVLFELLVVVVVIDEVFRIAAMPQRLTTKLDSLAHQGVS